MVIPLIISSYEFELYNNVIPSLPIDFFIDEKIIGIMITETIYIY